MKCYIVDAFTDKIFKGNPAAVCVLDRWRPDGLMQEIAGENNLSRRRPSTGPGRSPPPSRRTSA